MTDRTEIVVPRLSLETARVFIAEDDDSKLEAVTASLGRVGLDRNVEVARTYVDAQDYMDAQVPGHLTADIFLLDGNLDPHISQDTRQGDALMRGLFDKYWGPYAGLRDKAIELLMEGGLGLTQNQAKETVRQDTMYGLAVKKFNSEGLFVGISRTRDGRLHEPAQIEWAPYEQVGEEILANVPQDVRNKLMKQKRAEDQRADALARNSQV